MSLLDLSMLHKVSTSLVVPASVKDPMFEVAAVAELGKVLTLLEPEWTWKEVVSAGTTPDYWTHVQNAFELMVCKYHMTSPTVVLDAVNTWHGLALQGAEEQKSDPRAMAVDAVMDAMHMVLGVEYLGDYKALASFGVLSAVFGKEPSDLTK